MALDNRGPRIYLASRSPRRLIADANRCQLRYDCVPCAAREDKEIDETPLPAERPIDYVQRVAEAKARHGARIVVWRRLLPRPVLAADTTLELDGEIIGKPLDVDDAVRILQRLSGKRTG